MNRIFNIMHLYFGLYKCQPLSSSDGAQSLQDHAQPDTFGVFLTGGFKHPKW